MMTELDLHGVSHKEAEVVIEDFILANDTPIRIITGNSPTMKRLVEEVIVKYGLVCDIENHFNLGSLIIYEDC